VFPQGKDHPILQKNPEEAQEPHEGEG